MGDQLFKAWGSSFYSLVASIGCYQSIRMLLRVLTFALPIERRGSPRWKNNDTADGGTVDLHMSIFPIVPGSNRVLTVSRKTRVIPQSSIASCQ